MGQKLDTILVDKRELEDIINRCHNAILELQTIQNSAIKLLSIDEAYLTIKHNAKLDKYITDYIQEIQNKNELSDKESMLLTRVKHTLLAMGVHTIRDFLYLTTKDITKQKNCGKTIAQGIINLAKDNGIEIGPEPTVKIPEIFTQDIIMLRKNTAQKLGLNPHKTYTVNTVTGLHKSNFNTYTVESDEVPKNYQFSIGEIVSTGLFKL